jgi:hypothetical protein
LVQHEALFFGAQNPRLGSVSFRARLIFSAQNSEPLQIQVKFTQQLFGF